MSAHGDDDSPPDSLGRHRIEGSLGAGGMGRVYLGRDPELRRPIAIKVMRRSAVEDPAARSRFLAEARVTGQLEHPNIVPVYELGETETGSPYYTMKRVEGRPLTAVLAGLRRGVAAEQWPLSRRINLLIQVCQAVGYAHDRGVLHRDLKPDNIMVGRFAEVLVVDWGLAREVGEPEEPLQLADESGLSVARTLAGEVLGTPGYLSPEQARGELDRLSPATDVFSLGCILYELITLRRAFDGDTVLARLYRLLEGEAEPLRTFWRRSVDAGLARICQRAMAADPADRPTDSAVLADELEAWQARRAEAGLRRRGIVGRIPIVVAALTLFLISAWLVGTILLAGWFEKQFFVKAEYTYQHVPDQLRAARLEAESLRREVAGLPDEAFALRRAAVDSQPLPRWQDLEARLFADVLDRDVTEPLPVAPSPDPTLRPRGSTGLWEAAVEDGAVRIWSARGARWHQRVAEGAGVFDLSFAADDHLLLVRRRVGAASLHDLISATLVMEWHGLVAGPGIVDGQVWWVDSRGRHARRLPPRVPAELVERAGSLNHHLVCRGTLAVVAVPEAASRDVWAPRDACE